MDSDPLRDVVPSGTLDELRAYAERVSQERGMATVIVAVGGAQHEYVVPPYVCARAKDAVAGALLDALKQRVEQVDLGASAGEGSNGQ